MHDDILIQQLRDAIRRKASMPPEELFRDLVDRGVIDESGRVLKRFSRKPRMGSSIHIHIGPYLRVKMGERTVKDVQKGCAVHKRRMTTRFCPECGAEAVEVAVTKPMTTGNADYAISLLFEAEDIDEDTFFSIDASGLDDELWYAANADVPEQLCRYDSLDGGSGLIASGEDIDIPGDIAAFEKAYAKPIAMIKKNFGDDAVCVDWGVIRYWS